MTLPILGFARAELLWLLAALPLIVALVVLSYRARVRALRSFGGGSALVSRSSGRWWLKSVLVVVALASLVIALAGPYVDLRQRAARRLGVDIVLAVDVSQSMAARDVQPDRLRAARHFSEELGRQMIGSRVALVLFAGQGTVRYPPTTDPRILGEVLDNSGRGVRLTQGSSLRAGIESALGAFPADLDPLRQRAIVLVSDGEITNSDVPEASELEGREDPRRRYRHHQGGRDPAVRREQRKVHRLLEGRSRRHGREPSGGGDASVRRGQGRRALLPVSGQRRRHQRSRAGPSQHGGDRTDRRRWAPFQTSAPRRSSRSPPSSCSSSGSSRTGVGCRHRGAPVALSRVAAAASSASRSGRATLWAVACGDAALTNESANGLFAAGDYTGALAAYRDLQIDLPEAPELAVNAGNALHMLREYPRALPEYGKAIEGQDLKLRAIAQYDRGNTLFRMSRYEDARDAYREVLRIDPTDRDAKFNLEVIQRILTARPNQPGPQPSPGQGQPGSPGPSAPGAGQSGPPGASGSPQPGSSQPGANQGEPQAPHGRSDGLRGPERGAHAGTSTGARRVPAAGSPSTRRCACSTRSTASSAASACCSKARVGPPMVSTRR